MDPTIVIDNDVDSDGEDNYEGEDLTIPPKRYERLEVNGEEFDLRDPEQAEDAQDTTQEYRHKMRNGQLDEYEGKSTDLWKGGRTRLMYDELRADMAVDYHEGKHTLTWEQQHQEAERIRSIRAAQLRAESK